VLAIHKFQMNHRSAAMRVALGAALHARLATDATRRINDENIFHDASLLSTQFVGDKAVLREICARMLRSQFIFFANWTSVSNSVAQRNRACSNAISLV
jgi:hypothetical protein